MPSLQTKSKQRIADHGEVYTSEREVKAMLDLVADQFVRPETSFLEPACGTGNFLVEILRRKLDAVGRKHKKVQLDYEKNAVTAVASLYGIELLPDNVEECRDRLLDIFQNHYQTAFPKTFKTECLHTVRYILSKNIVCGDALTLAQNDGTPIVFSHWAFTTGSRIQRRDFVYRRLVEQNQTTDGGLFSDDLIPPEDKILKPLQTYPSVHFLELDRV